MKARVKRFIRLWVGLFDKHLLLDHASAIAFNVLKALVPLSLLGVALLGVLGGRHVWTKTIYPSIQPHLSAPTAHAINAAVLKIFATDSTGLILFASVLVVWYVSGAVRAVMGSINDIYQRKETREWTKRYPLSFGLAAAIALCLVGATVAVAVGPALASHGFAGVVVSIGRWLVAIALLALAIGLLVHYAPVEQRGTRWASAGSLLVIVAWIGATALFELFVSHVANFKTAVGGLTVFLVLIGYVYTSSIIFLIGVEVDELLRADAKGERGVLRALFGYSR